MNAPIVIFLLAFISATVLAVAGTAGAMLLDCEPLMAQFPPAGAGCGTSTWFALTGVIGAAGSALIFVTLAARAIAGK